MLATAPRSRQQGHGKRRPESVRTTGHWYVPNFYNYLSPKTNRGLGVSSIVAIFHASFHPTKGNLVDWCLKASDGTQGRSIPELALTCILDLQLDGVEFSTLPSGLHLVDRDIVYVQFLGPCYPLYSQSTPSVTSQKTVTLVFVFFAVGALRSTDSVDSDFLPLASYS